MILTNIQNLILSKIRSNPALIDKDEHADVEDALLQNSYGTVYEEDSGDTTIITTVNPAFGFDYVVRFCKQGRFVYVNGYIYNNTGSAISGTGSYFFEITNTEYKSLYGGFCVGSGGKSIWLSSSNKLYVDSLGAETGLNFTLIYTTEN